MRGATDPMSESGSPLRRDIESGAAVPGAPSEWTGVQKGGGRPSSLDPASNKPRGRPTETPLDCGQDAVERNGTAMNRYRRMQGRAVGGQDSQFECISFRRDKTQC